jgi:hypothetical protein
VEAWWKIWLETVALVCTVLVWGCADLGLWHRLPPVVAVVLVTSDSRVEAASMYVLFHVSTPIACQHAALYGASVASAHRTMAKRSQSLAEDGPRLVWKLWRLLMTIWSKGLTGPLGKMQWLSGQCE